MTKDEALRMALEALEEISSQYMSLPKKGCMALAAIEEALAEQPAQQQEPVAKIHTWHRNGMQHAELLDWGTEIESLPDGEHELYTTPPQRNPLTDEQKDAKRWAYIRKHWKTISFRFNKRPNTLSGFTLTVSDKVNNDDAYLLEKEIDDAIEAAHGIKE